MDQILEQARSIYEGEIVCPPKAVSNQPQLAITYDLQDFAGQRLAEQISTVLLCISGALAFLVGFITQNIYQTLYIGLGGTALTFLIVVPPWPFFNQQPQPWLPPKTGRGALTQGISVEVDGKKIS